MSWSPLPSGVGGDMASDRLSDWVQTVTTVIRLDNILSLIYVINNDADSISLCFELLLSRYSSSLIKRSLSSVEYYQQKQQQETW